MEQGQTYSHRPVLLDECIEGLRIRPGGLYLDGTLGRAGHSREIARRLDTGRLVCIDRDQAALDAAQDRLAGCLDKVELIPCGGGNPIDAAREQWSDASNTLAVAPGEVVVYSRNYVTNRLLEEHGVTIHCIPSSELSRGRGGPRCMSMPFVRD